MAVVTHVAVCYRKVHSRFLYMMKMCRSTCFLELVAGPHQRSPERVSLIKIASALS